MGHVYKEHGNGIHSEKDLKFGPWLLAEPSWRGRGRGRGGPGRGLGRFGRGRGQGQDGYMDDEVYKEEVDGVERALVVLGEPKPDIDMDEAENNRKRGLANSQQATSVVALVNQFEKSPTDVVSPASPQPKRDPKRHRKDGREEDEINGNSTDKSELVGSSEGRRQDQ